MMGKFAVSIFIDRSQQDGRYFDIATQILEAGE